MRMILIGFVCFFVVTYLSAFGFDSDSFPVEQVELDLQLQEDELAFLFLDLPCGEATLVKSADQTMLIGTGAASSYKELAKRLKKFHIKELETIILPRLENDYAGNTQTLLNAFKVKKLIVPEDGKKIVEKQFARGDLEIIGWNQGIKKDVLPSLDINVLPNLDESMQTLSLSMTFNDHHFFFAAEANEEVEKKWMDSTLEKVNVLKVAEFGLKKISQSFLDVLDPQVAIMYSKENSVPLSQILERMQETWIDTYQTRQNGTILIKVDASDYELLTVKFKD